MKALALFTFLTVLPIAAATIAPERHPIGAASPTGRYVVRIAPEDHAPAMVAIYELSEDGSTYAKSREYRLGDRLAACDVCISDKAEVITFGSCGKQGNGPAVVWHTSEGKVKRRYSLKEILPQKVFAEIQARPQARSSIEWRHGQPFFDGPALLIPDVFGGWIILGDEVIEYEENKK